MHYIIQMPLWSFCRVQTTRTKYLWQTEEGFLTVSRVLQCAGGCAEVGGGVPQGTETNDDTTKR